MSFFFREKNMIKLILPLLLAFGFTVLLRTELNRTKERVLPPPVGMEHYSFGFSENLSDLLWLQFIQNSYVCDKEEACSKNWGYLVLLQASKLTPRFRSLYSLGAANLSILLDDDYGAKTVFDQGLKYFPEDWEINYRAGYHYLLELEQPARAADLFDMASRHGAPMWTRSLSAQLYSRTGRLQVSEQILKDMMQYQMGEEWDEALGARLKEVQKKMAEQRKNEMQ